MRLAAALLALCAVTGSAGAFSSVPGHADITVKAKHKTIDGVKCIVGCKVSFKVRNPTSNSAYAPAKYARPSVWLPAAAKGLREHDRNRTHDEDAFTGIKIFADVPVPSQGAVFEGSFDLDYAKHGVASGQRLTLVTAWKWASSNPPHVYGAVTSYDTANEFDLP